MRLLTDTEIRSLVDARGALDAVRVGVIALTQGGVTMPDPMEDFPH